MATLIAFPYYKFMRAIQSGSLMRVCFWTPFCVLAGMQAIKTYVMFSPIIHKIYLKECGTQIVI